MATQYARYKFIALDANGVPVSGAGIEIRRQGATVNGLHSGAQTVFTVNDPGVIKTSGTPDQVAVGTGSTSLGVTAVGATSVTVAGPGFTDVPDDARLTITNNFPTLYNDAQGAETKSNPLTTDATGLAECWLERQPIDVAVRPTGPAGAVTILYQDEYPEGGGRVIFTDFPTAGAIARVWKPPSGRTFGTTHKYLSIQNDDGTEEFSFAGGGGQFMLGKAGSTASNTINGNTNMVGAFAVSSGTLSCSAGFTHSGGAVSFVAGAIAGIALAANAIHPAPSNIAGTSTDVTVLTSETVRLTTSYNPTSGNVGVRVIVNLPYAMISEGTGQVLVRLYIGGVLKARGVFGHWTAAATDMNSSGTVSFEWIEPTMAASPTTIEVRDIVVTRGGGTTATYQYDGASSYAGYMTISELKK